MSTLQTTVGFINIHRILETRLRNKGGKFLNFLEAKAKMETQAVIESVTHACTYAQMYFLFNNQECALLASILLCVCVCFRDWYESLKSTFPKMYSQEILVHIPSVIALMPQVLEAGRVVESLVQLEHWVWAVHILDHCSSSPKPPRQYLL